MNKRELREKTRQMLAGFSKKEIENKSILVSRNLKFLIEKLYSKHLFRNGLIGAYVPFKGEVVWFCDFEHPTYHFAVPHLLDDVQMEYHRVDFDQLRDQKVGLRLETFKQSGVVIPDLLLVPGLAFTKKGERLGRGKGYFDRYLNSYKGLKIGIAFNQQIYDSIPTEVHDELLDYLVTETNIYEIDKGK